MSPVEPDGEAAGQPDHRQVQMDLSEEVVLVTGGASGIGWAVAVLLAGWGARIGVLDVAPLPDGAPAHAAVRGYRCDVTDPASVEQVVAAARTELGPCSALVHSAGWTPLKPFSDITCDEQERVVAVNFTGALNVCREVLPQMQANGSGRVVFVSSDAARVGVSGEAVYAGAKAALSGFARSLAVEVARHQITVNVVSPGSTDTPLFRSMFSQEEIDRRVRANPMRRIATPLDVAHAIAFLLGPQASFVTGQVLSVNGGMARVG